MRLRILKAKSRLLRLLLDEIEFRQLMERVSRSAEWTDYLESLDCSVKLKPGEKAVSKLLNAFVFKSPYGQYGAAVYEVAGTPLAKVIQTYYSHGVGMSAHVSGKIIAELGQILGLANITGIVNLGVTSHSLLLVPTDKVDTSNKSMENHDVTVDEMISRHKKLLKKHHIAKMQAPASLKDSDSKHLSKDGRLLSNQMLLQT